MVTLPNLLAVEDPDWAAILTHAVLKTANKSQSDMQTRNQMVTEVLVAMLKKRAPTAILSKAIKRFKNHTIGRKDSYRGSSFSGSTSFLGYVLNQPSDSLQWQKDVLRTLVIVRDSEQRRADVKREAGKWKFSEPISAMEYNIAFDTLSLPAVKLVFECAPFLLGNKVNKFLMLILRNANLDSGDSVDNACGIVEITRLFFPNLATLWKNVTTSILSCPLQFQYNVRSIDQIFNAIHLEYPSLMNDSKVEGELAAMCINNGDKNECTMYSSKILQSLVKIAPNALRRRSLEDNRLPLHIVLEMGTKCHAKLAAVLDAYPEAVDYRCPMTKLYPFQLAATNYNIDDTYTCLRRSPTLIGSVVNRTSENDAAAFKLVNTEAVYKKTEAKRKAAMNILTEHQRKVRKVLVNDQNEAQRELEEQQRKVRQVLNNEHLKVLGVFDDGHEKVWKKLYDQQQAEKEEETGVLTALHVQMYPENTS